MKRIASTLLIITIYFSGIQMGYAGGGYLEKKWCTYANQGYPGGF